MSYPRRVMRSEGAGFSPPLAPAPKMHPSEIALTLSADVLRLPYPPATRLVLAEIVSLHAANAGRCDCSDAHLAARLSISKDTASVAVQLLEKDGLLTKQTKRLPAGFYRTLTPVPAAIAEKAQTNPYPENAPTRKMPVAYPEIPGSPTRKMPVALPGNSGSNTPSNIPISFQQASTPPTPAADAASAGAEKKLAELADIVVGQSASENPTIAAHTEGGATDVATSVQAPDKTDKTDTAPDKTDKRVRAKPRPPDEPEAFGELYDLWPKHVSRQDAARAYAKLSLPDRLEAIPRARAWLAASPNVGREGNRFVPNLATWLNNARWTDSFPEPVSSLPHATDSQPFAQQARPVNGHKPAGYGGAMARFLAEHD